MLDDETVAILMNHLNTMILFTEEKDVDADYNSMRLITGKCFGKVMVVNMGRMI